jgi:hypothetical protein
VKGAREDGKKFSKIKKKGMFLYLAPPSKIMKQVCFPQDRFACKILPTLDFNHEYFTNGQTDLDWSGIYVQFSISHAMAYLPNHFDRGQNVAYLVMIESIQEMNYIKYDNPEYSDPNLPSE